MSQTQIPNLLSLLMFLPLFGALIVMFLPRPVDVAENEPGNSTGYADTTHGGSQLDTTAELAITAIGRQLVSGVALFFAGLSLLLAIALFAAFQLHPAPLSSVSNMGRNMQFVEDYQWIAVGSSYMHYKLGVDGISLLLILLTTLLVLLCVVFSSQTKVRLKEFMVFLLLLETALIGVFCALDLVLFYIFFEATLIPMFLLIGIFGQKNRAAAAVKFFVYTFAGSIFMLVAIVAVYSYTGTFDILALSNHTQGAGMLLAATPANVLMLMFGGFALAFLIKVPIFPFHTWLPDAYTEAPTVGTVILTGLMMKMGTYGLIRICLPLFPQQAKVAAPLFIVLSVVSIVYASLVAAVQQDSKRLLAYSSVAHAGFIVLGIFTFTRVGLMGALIQNFNHGISTPMLFFIVGMLYERRQTNAIGDYGGLKRYVPMLSTLLLIAMLSSIAVPFFNGFVGEFPILVGAWISQPAYALGGYWPVALAASGMIWSAVYMLWWYQRLMLGPITRPANRLLPDLTRTEWAVLLPLAAMIFWVGVGSHFWTQRLEATVDTMLPVQGEQNLSEQLNDMSPLSGKIQRERQAEQFGGSVESTQGTEGTGQGIRQHE